MSSKGLYAIATSAAILGSSILSLPARAVDINDLFVFGDSYSDTGAFFKLTNPDGSTAVGYLAQDFGITLTTSKNADPGTDGVNFAESGARVFVGPTPPATQPRSLTQQVAEFQNYVDNDKVTFDPSTSLFFLLGGLNDHTKVTSAQVDAATASQVATLYSLGARIFEIALLPASVPPFTDSADNFDPGYETLVPELKAEYPDAVFNLSNWGPDYDFIHDNPSLYGLTNTTDPCNTFGASPVCSAPNTYFYYYVVHPSAYVHEIVGNELYNEVLRLPSPVPEPSTWAMMLLGFLGLGFAGYRRARTKVVAA
jgi:phospholipase/lecithinase/hemolysin